jgi:very-short-patch-repair endonuclease
MVWMNMPERNKSGYTSRELRIRARQLRKQATPAEKILWEQLRNRRLNGIKFRRQHPLGKYIIDSYCPAHRLVIEIDGEFHRYQVDQDQARMQELEDFGYRVIRFWNHEVEHKLMEVLERIINCSSHPSPTSGRRATPERSEGAGDEGNP